jgi:hypothetical protein
LTLENFVYDSIQTSDFTIRQRLAWLRSQKFFSVQPYEQAAKALRLTGRNKDARRIGRAKQNDLRHYGKLGSAARAWNFLLDVSLGHGYQIWRVVVVAFAVVVVGAILFNHAYMIDGLMLLKGSEPHPDFQPFVYSLDVFLPIVDLHQKEYWIPFTQSGCSYFYIIYLWIHICLGWLLTTLAIAGLTGIVKKD